MRDVGHVLAAHVHVRGHGGEDGVGRQHVLAAHLVVADARHHRDQPPPSAQHGAAIVANERQADLDRAAVVVTKASADDGVRIRVGDCPGDRQRALGKARPLEDAHRAVPEHGLRHRDALGVALPRGRPDVQAEPTSGHALGRHHL